MSGTTNPNAKPCFLHGCDPVPSADGSTVCKVCGIYTRPCPAMVNALLRAGAGGREYRKLAAQALNLARLEAPAIPAPIEPPLYLGADGSRDLPPWWAWLPSSILVGVALGLWISRLVWGTL